MDTFISKVSDVLRRPDIQQQLETMFHPLNMYVQNQLYSRMQIVGVLLAANLVFTLYLALIMTFWCMRSSSTDPISFFTGPPNSTNSVNSHQKYKNE